MIRFAASRIRLDFELISLGDRLIPKLIVGGLLAISDVAKTERWTNLNPEARRGDLRF
ncbi:hypothetical protein [Bradyrhizobium jicamae]|uniref:hypothetical protein n=1 Tax=Bradyrhizobium jicamae TaxID=280332 RepID=UPI000B2FB4B8|nr:hypothetical protein [Bradyrhizobium jicamae]